MTISLNATSHATGIPPHVLAGASREPSRHVRLFAAGSRGAVYAVVAEGREQRRTGLSALLDEWIVNPDPDEAETLEWVIQHLEEDRQGPGSLFRRR